MRIGILTHNYPRASEARYDAGIFIHDFAQELAKQASVFVLCPDFKGRKERYKKVPVTWFDWAGGNEKLGSWTPTNPFYLVKFINLMLSGQKSCLRFVQDNKIDFLLACWALPAGVFALSAKTKLGIPYATWSLGSDINKYVNYPILRQLIGRALARADHRFANSYLLIDKIKKIYGLSSNFLPAITDFSPLGIRPAKLDKRRLNLLFVGRLEPIKGIDILVEACGQVKRQDFHLWILGDGSLRGELENRVKKLGIGNHVSFFGQANKEEVASFMLASSCLVVPSRSESLPLVVIEAARANLPVIATAVGDCPRLVNKYNIGVISGSSPNDLAAVLEKVIAQGSGFKKKHKSGLEKLAKDFSQEKAVGDFLTQVAK